MSLSKCDICYILSYFDKLSEGVLCTVWQISHMHNLGLIISLNVIYKLKIFCLLCILGLSYFTFKCFLSFPIEIIIAWYSSCIDCILDLSSLRHSSSPISPRISIALIRLWRSSLSSCRINISNFLLPVDRGILVLFPLHFPTCQYIFEPIPLHIIFKTKWLSKCYQLFIGQILE